MNQAPKHVKIGLAGAKRPETTPASGSVDAIPSEQAEAQEARFAREVLETEARAIERIQITPDFHEAVKVILDATSGPGAGSIVVSGLGKSGIVGQKISATLASTGTPSHFLHPTEAMHGDLGKVRREDVVLLLSFGGNTHEVVSLATLLKQDGVSTISIVGKLACDLAKLSSVALSIGDIAEACPLNLAPTASTTAMLALGDALAMAVSRRRGFSVDDFQRVHPGGALGRQLMPVVDAMRFRIGQNLVLVGQDVTVGEAIRVETQAPESRRAGALMVVDVQGRLIGIFTDGDLRRLLIQFGADAMSKAVKEIMTTHPRRLCETSLVRDAVQMVRQFRIDEIPVVDAEGRPLGLIDVQDLVALKVIEES